MDVTDSPMVMVVREVHPENAFEWIDLAESGTEMEVREVHPENA